MSAPTTTDQVIQETDILKPDGLITFPARDKPLDPHEFFNRMGVSISDSFRKDVFPVLMSVASTPERTYGVEHLKDDYLDREIRQNLPKHHLGNWEDIASLIEMYPNGKEEEEGYNRLYLEGVDRKIFVVRVKWLSGYREWFVGGIMIDSPHRDGAGDRVLYPDNVAL